MPDPFRLILYWKQALASGSSCIGKDCFFERVAIDRKIGSTGSRQGEGGLNVNLQDRYVDGGLLPSRMLCDVDTAPDVPADFPAS